MPAGSLETLKTAILYGADAVYMGTPDMSMRTTSKLTLEDVVKGIEFAHENNAKVYLSLNVITHNKDIPKLPDYLESIRQVNPDGVIVADPGVFAYIRENAPELRVHISTQANSCSWLTVDYWKNQGASLVVMGREASFKELREIREKCNDIKLEIFVHGAMCMTYSGRCLLSNFMAERGANQGNCANSCRWNYKVHLKLKDGSVKDLDIDETNSDLFEFLLEEGYRPGDMLPIEEDERGAYILNSRDLCLMPKLDQYMDIGIDTLKIEGRGRSPYYVATCARAYRMAIDDWANDPEKWDSRPYMRELETLGSRGFTLAFHEGRLTNYAHGYESTSSVGEWEYGGMITEASEDHVIVRVKNRVEAGDILEFVPANSRKTYMLRMYEFETLYGEKKTEIHAGQQQDIRINFSAFDHEDLAEVKKALAPMTIIRKERPLNKAEKARVAHDREAFRMDQGKGSEKIYNSRREQLREGLEEEAGDRTTRSPRVGTEGCCGKGCNGCHIFWHDPSYEKARALLAKKKQGEMLKSGIIKKNSIQKSRT